MTGHIRRGNALQIFMMLIYIKMMATLLNENRKLFLILFLTMVN